MGAATKNQRGIRLISEEENNNGNKFLKKEMRNGKKK